MAAAASLPRGLRGRTRCGDPQGHKRPWLRPQATEIQNPAYRRPTTRETGLSGLGPMRRLHRRTGVRSAFRMRPGLPASLHIGSGSQSMKPRTPAPGPAFASALMAGCFRGASQAVERAHAWSRRRAGVRTPPRTTASGCYPWSKTGLERTRSSPSNTITPGSIAANSLLHG